MIWIFYFMLFIRIGDVLVETSLGPPLFWIFIFVFHLKVYLLCSSFIMCMIIIEFMEFCVIKHFILLEIPLLIWLIQLFTILLYIVVSHLFRFSFSPYTMVIIRIKPIFVDFYFHSFIFIKVIIVFLSFLDFPNDFYRHIRVGVMAGLVSLILVNFNY
jgi:hypothetical protein